MTLTRVNDVDGATYNLLYVQQVKLIRRFVIEVRTRGNEPQLMTAVRRFKLHYDSTEVPNDSEAL